MRSKVKPTPQPTHEAPTIAKTTMAKWLGERLKPSLMDIAVGLAIWFVAFVWVVATASDIGVGYDEPIYGGYALRYLAWLQLLVDCWMRGDFLTPFRFEVIDTYWHAKDMHPPIPKLIAALGYAVMTPLLGDDYAAMRSGTGFLFGAMLAAIYWSGRIPLTRAGALFAVGAVAFMPRMFADAHFLTMDMPVTATTVIGTLLLLQALERPSRWRLIAAMLGVGAAFASKANGFLIIPAAVAFVVATSDWRSMWRDKTQWRPFAWALGRSLGVIALVGAGAMAFLFATWLWLWVDPLHRFRDYFTFHAKHFVVHTFYLGRLWAMAPWHYPLVMTAVTVPAVTLLTALCGAGVTLWRWGTAPALAQMALLSYCVHIAPFLLPTTPKYNGVRLFEPAFPFLGILAGYAFGTAAQALTAWLRAKAAQWISSPHLCVTALGIVLLAPAAHGTLSSHPFGLSYYNALVSGVQGAKERFEVTYWGVNLLSLLPFLNRQPQGTKVFVFPGALHTYMQFYQRAQMLRDDITVLGNPRDLPDADFVVFQASQTEILLARQTDPPLGDLLWRLWWEATPAYAAIYDGVVIAGVYDRATVARFLRRPSPKPTGR